MSGLSKKNSKVSKINRYLKYQEKRLHRHLEKGNFDAVVLIFFLLLKSSFSYQFVLYHRCRSKWYFKQSKTETMKELENVIKKLRLWNLNLYLRRFYVIKNKVDPERNGKIFEGTLLPGEKLRPIGAPDTCSAVISKSFNDLITFIYPERSQSQHGYIPNRGVYTAITRIIALYLENPQCHIIEYDFRSYFNKVSLNWVVWKLEEKSKMLANVIGSMILNVVYLFEDLQPESELHCYGIKMVNKKPKFLVLRSGMPQGLSISPLLSTLAQEFIPPHPGNVAYADDGLFFSEDPEEFYFYLETLGGYGVSIAEEKTGVVDKEQDVKFCGFTINFSKETVTYNDSTKSFRDGDIKEWLKRVTSFYGKKPKKWTWEINPSSFIMSLDMTHKLGFVKRMATIALGYFDMSFEGNRYFPELGIFPISQSSSLSCEELCNSFEVSSSMRRKGLTIPVFSELKQLSERKKTNYLESYYEVDVLEGTNNFSEHIELVNLFKRKMELEKV